MCQTLIIIERFTKRIDWDSGSGSGGSGGGGGGNDDDDAILSLLPTLYCYCNRKCGLSFYRRCRYIGCVEYGIDTYLFSMFPFYN